MKSKLLIADDSLTIQKVIRLALSNEGYEIQAISEGNEAIQQISVFRPNAVLIDVSLPGKTAFEVKRAINEMSDLSGTKFILMSSAFEKVDETQAAQVGFDGRLTKPFDPAHLRKILVDVLANSVGPAVITPPADLPSLGDWESRSAAKIPPLPAPFTPPPGAEHGDELWSKEISLSPPDHSEIIEPPPPVHDPLQGDEDAGDIKNLTESTLKMSGLAERAANEENLPDFDWNIREPTMKPLSSFNDKGGSSFDLEPPANVRTPSPPEQPRSSDAPVDEIVRRQVEETLAKMAQKMIPEIAERLIKQEINRLLNERP